MQDEVEESEQNELGSSLEEDVSSVSNESEDE